jgi:hypothetical protein
MPDDPYRPAPAEPDPELARLAAKGRKRLESAQTTKRDEFRAEESRNIRTASGGTPWSTMRLAIVGVGVLGAALAFVPGAVATNMMGLQVVGIFLIAALAIGSVVGQGQASDAQVEGERRWGVNKITLSNNAPFVRYVHGLVDRVLQPLHRKHPLKSVALSRK